jgi:hypothetical protein
VAAVERDDGTTDWDAAFEAVIAGLRPPRHVRVARIAVQATATAILLAIAAWMVLTLVAESLEDLGRPWL